MTAEPIETSLVRIFLDPAGVHRDRGVEPPRGRARDTGIDDPRHVVGVRGQLGIRAGDETGGVSRGVQGDAEERDRLRACRRLDGRRLTSASARQGERAHEDGGYSGHGQRRQRFDTASKPPMSALEKSVGLRWAASFLRRGPRFGAGVRFGSHAAYASALWARCCAGRDSWLRFLMTPYAAPRRAEYAMCVAQPTAAARFERP